MTVKSEKSSLDFLWNSPYTGYKAYFQLQEKVAKMVRKQFKHSIYGMDDEKGASHGREHDSSRG